MICLFSGYHQRPEQSGQPTSQESIKMNITIEQVKEYSVTAYNPLVASIAALQEKYKDVVYDMTTVDGVTSAMSELKEFKSLHSKVDKARLEIKRPILDIGNEIDRVGHEFKIPLKARIDELNAPIELFWENERVRVAAIESRIESIKSRPMTLLGKTSEYMRDCLQDLIETNSNDFQEYNHAAKAAIDATILLIEPIIEDRERIESEMAKQACQQREQKAIIDAQQKEIDDARKQIQAENNRIAQEKHDRENNERIALERAEAAKAALIKADQDRVEREIREAEEKAKALALMPEVDAVVAWLELIIGSAPLVRDEKLARLVTSVKAASSNHIRAFKEAKAA
jgi:hypothetical protein